MGLFQRAFDYIVQKFAGDKVYEAARSKDWDACRKKWEPKPPILVIIL